MSQSLALTPRSWSYLFLISLFFGGSFVSHRIALEEVPVFTTVAFRLTGGALLLWLWVLAQRKPLGLTSRTTAVYAVLGVVNNALPFSLIVWGQQYIDSGLASILNASTAVFTVLLAALFFADERLTPPRLIGLALGFFGVATAIGLDKLTHFDPTQLGQLASLTASLSYAVSALIARRFLPSMRPDVTVAMTLGFASLYVLPIAFVQNGLPTFDWHWQTWSALLYLCIFPTAIALLLVFHLIKIAGAGNTSLITLLLVPLAITLGAVIYHERLSADDYAGFALLALGLLILDGRLRLPRRR